MATVFQRHLRSITHLTPKLLKSYDPLRSTTVFKLPEPPVAPSPDQPAPVVVHKVDWEEVGFSEYKGRVTFIIDNVFTREECRKLLNMVESHVCFPDVHSGSPQAGDEQGVVMKDYREPSQIILHSSQEADFILSKLKPHLPQEAVDVPKSRYLPFKRDDSEDEDVLRLMKEVGSNGRLQLKRLNKCLRYFKYVEGDFFEPDYNEISCLTLQLYLNGSKENLEGGATQFLGYRTRDRVIEVDPRPGRALIFEPESLIHCGTKVLKGEKYTIRTDLMFKKVPG